MLPLPLALCRILDLTQSLAAAAASRHLADFGAEVILLERPGASPARESSRALLRNKYSCLVDLARAEARDLVLELGTQSDAVLVDAEDPALAAAGLSYEAFRAARDDIIVVSVGEGGRPGLGAMVAAAVLTAMFQHRYGGAGAHISVPAPASRAGLAGLSVLAQSAGASAATPDLPASGVYACGGGSIAVAVRSAAQLAALGEAVGRPELADALSGGIELREPLTQWTAQRGAGEAASLLLAAGVPAQALLSAPDLRHDPHLLARGLFEPVAEGDAVELVDGVRFRFAGTPAHVRLPPPSPGQHRAYVLRDIAGLDEAQIAALAAAGVVGSP